MRKSGMMKICQRIEEKDIGKNCIPWNGFSISHSGEAENDRRFKTKIPCKRQDSAINITDTIRCGS